MKHLLVTGASAGIGRATAELFLNRGWRVGVMARRSAVLEEVFGGYANAMLLPMRWP